MEKHIFTNGFINMFYENNFFIRNRNIGLGFRYEFSFAQTSVSAQSSNGFSTVTESAHGSFILDHHNNYFNFNSRSSVGKAGIDVVAFLDLNCNGRRDNDEPKVSGLNLHINGGRVIHNNKDTSILVLDLEPYASYFIRLDPSSFDNYSWRIRKLTLNVTADPNEVKFIEVPVSVMAEASGKVFISSSLETKGIGGILVSFFNKESLLVGRTLTEADGFFSFLGLAPGKYTARIDSMQLRKLQLTSSPANIPINVLRNKDGDVVDGLQFIIHSPSWQPAEIKEQ